MSPQHHRQFNLVVILIAGLFVASCGSSVVNPPGAVSGGGGSSPAVSAPAVAPSPSLAAVPTNAASASATPGASPIQRASAIPPLGDVPMYRMDNERSSVEPGPGPVAAPVLIWARKAASPINGFNAILADGTLFVGADDGHLYALDARTGETRWVFDAGAPLHGAAVADGGLVFVASDDHILHAVDAVTGTERWRASSVKEAEGAVGGVVYVAGSDRNARGLDETNGSERWAWLAPDDMNLTVVDGTAYINVAGGTLYAIDIATGLEQWHFKVLGDSASFPMVTDDVVITSSGQGAGEPSGELDVLDRATGLPRWRFRGLGGGQIAAGAIRDGILYTPSADLVTYAFHLESNQPIWSTPDTGSGYRPPALAGDVLYAPTEDLGIVAVRATDGKKLWAVKTPGVLEGTLVVSGGLVFAADTAGEIRAYGEPSLAGPGGPVSIATLLDGSTASASPTPPPNPFRITATLAASTTGIQGAEALALGSDGNVYVLDGRPMVSVVSPAGKLLRSWGRHGTHDGEFDLNDPLATGSIAVGPDGKVYVSDPGNARVQVFGPDGAFIRKFGAFGSGDGQFEAPYQLAADAQGNVYVEDAGSLTLTKWDKAGHFLWRVAKGAPAADTQQFDHTGGFDNRGRLWFLGGGDAGPAFATNSDGVQVEDFGDVGFGLGQLDDPCSIGLDDAGHTFIWDCSAPRIQAFDTKHRLIGAWVTDPPHPIREKFVVTPDGGLIALGADDSILEISVDLPSG